MFEGRPSFLEGGYKYPLTPDDDTFVRRAVEEILQHQTLEVVYQPIVDHVEGIVCAHEALSRPQYDGQFIPPDVWFRAAFERNRSIEADWLALTISISRLRGLPSEMTFDTPLFVNVMPSSLVQEPFIEQLELLFREGFCEPHQLVIEIVEYISYDVARLSRMAEIDTVTRHSDCPG